MFHKIFLSAALLLALVTLTTFAAASTHAAPNGSTIVVTTTLDNTTGGDGKCTLREAITNANANSDTTSGDCAAGSGTDKITFNIQAGLLAGQCNILTFTCTILPSSNLPPITDPLIINGYTQGDASPNTLDVGDNAQLRMILNGKYAGQQPIGLDLKADGSTIKGLTIQQYNFAIWVESDNNVIEGNFIGTDYTGSTAAGSTGGIVLYGNGNYIGNTTASARNLISGNVDGVYVVAGQANLIQGNYIGTDAQGQSAIPNQIGIEIHDASQNTIGGKGVLARNVISGNFAQGIKVSNLSADNHIHGNFIGIAADKTTALGNGGPGIDFTGDDVNNDSPIDSIVLKNHIANNAQGGIRIGCCAVDLTTGISASRNAIFSNGGLGIDLESDVVTLNDKGDGDSGPNGLQNFPVLKSATSGGGTTTITGKLNSYKNKSYQIEFFKSPTCNASGYGEGKKYLGSVDVTTDNTGNATFTFVKSKNYPVGNVVTATATELVNGELRSTSEFSQCVSITN